MEFTVEVPIVITARPSGLRRSRTVFAKTTTTVEIGTIDPGDAPVVASVASRPPSNSRVVYRQRGAEFLAPLDFPLSEIPFKAVLFGRSLPYLPAAERIAEIERRAVAVSIRSQGDGSVFPARLSRLFGERDTAVLPDIGSLDLEGFDDADIDLQVSEYLALFESMAVIDGRPYGIVGEPLIALRAVGGDSSRFDVRVVSAGDRWNGIASPDELPHAQFRLDRAASALEFCLAAGAMPAIAIRQFEEIALHIEDGITLFGDSDRASMFALARIISRRAVRNEPDPPPAELFRLVDECDETSYPEELGDMVVDFCCTHYANWTEGCGAFARNIELHMAKGVVNMWPERSVTLDITMPEEQAGVSSAHPAFLSVASTRPIVAADR